VILSSDSLAKDLTWKGRPLEISVSRTYIFVPACLIISGVVERDLLTTHTIPLDKGALRVSRDITLPVYFSTIGLCQFLRLQLASVGKKDQALALPPYP
jgi:hypothetical protein